MTTDTARRRDPARRPRSRPLLLDTSAAVALVIEDHEAHAAVLEAVAGQRLGLAGHAWFETYSVLTRLPAGQRRAPAVVARILETNFPGSLHLDATDAARLAQQLAGMGIAGGAVFDALVAAVAREHGLALVSADRRARPTYDAMGVSVIWIAAP